MPLSGPDSSQDLEFPPVRVNHGLTQLDLDTLMMRSTTRRLPEEPGSSLDDSTYELLGDSLLDASLLDASDDEGHTASIASTEGPTPDNASDFSDDDNDYGTGNQELNDSIYSQHSLMSGQHPDLHSVATEEDSILTEIPSHMEASESSRKIKLQEQITQDSSVVAATKTIKDLSDQSSSLPQVLTRYGCSEIRLVVKAALSQRSIPTPDSYRILYIGMPEKWLEDVITSQIGAALTASPSVSRSVMVRGQIEPFGPVIHVYRCAELRTFAQHEKQSHVLILLDDGKQFKFGPGLPSPSEGRPDLVVFCHPTIPDATTDLQDFASASEVFGRENIPCIDLAQARPYGEGAPTYDLRSLRVCVEGRSDSNTDYELKEVLPLDHYTFSVLDASQLNRHLALLSPHLFSESDAGYGQGKEKPSAGGISKIIKKTLESQWGLAKLFLPVLFLSIIVPVMLQKAAFAPSLFNGAIEIASQPPISSQASDLISSITSDLLTHQSSRTAIPISAIPSVSATPRDLTVVPPQTLPQKLQAGKKSEKTARFDIQTTGDHQFILKPSKDFATSRKKPQLQIQITRQFQSVPARYNRTISGDYIVDLEHEYPFSTFNVSIATHSKPLVRQSFEIALGHNKSTLAQLLDTTKERLDSVQTTVLEGSIAMKDQLRIGWAGLEASLYEQVKGNYLLRQDVTEHLQDAKKVLGRRVSTSAELLKAAGGATWNGLKQATAPVRTSTPMLRARMNALRLRCRLEVATGLGSNGGVKEQSWACSKVAADSQE
ncbi:hypothetical protein IQ07DRAFT_625238 [Pyrenochaeta sp. DS3sAY3a]|nr:hypothetical protein IQ07DRAFT_625238 [Pyrenochaeta sp. DS3sAY3a]